MSKDILKSADDFVGFLKNEEFPEKEIIERVMLDIYNVKYVGSSPDGKIVFIKYPEFMTNPEVGSFSGIEIKKITDISNNKKEIHKEVKRLLKQSEFDSALELIKGEKLTRYITPLGIVKKKNSFRKPKYYLLVNPEETRSYEILNYPFRSKTGLRRCEEVQEKEAEKQVPWMDEDKYRMPTYMKLTPKELDEEMLDSELLEIVLYLKFCEAQYALDRKSFGIKEILQEYDDLISGGMTEERIFKKTEEVIKKIEGGGKDEIY